MSDDEWRLDESLRPGPEVTREMFLEWRNARPGDGNPTRMTNPVWVWLVRQPDVNAYQASKHFGVATVGLGPGWTNHRFGQSRTELPDGRVLAVAGEHEDYYDPDFYIYNDAIVVEPDGGIEILGYAHAAFPPTDFHSATLVGDHVYLVGNLGYSQERGTATQVLRLDVRTLAVETLAPGGPSPGWIFKHGARLDGDAGGIVVHGGSVEVTLPHGRQTRDVVDDHVLDLDSLTWRRLTDRRWSQYEIERTSGRGRLWEISQLAWHDERASDEWSRNSAADYRARISHEPDLAAWRTRFRPSVAHEPVAGDPTDPDEWRTHRITVDGVTVRYVDSSDGAHLVVEGNLPASTIDALVDDVRTKLARADAGEYHATCLDDPR